MAYVTKGKVYALFRSWSNDHKKNRSTVSIRLSKYMVKIQMVFSFLF